MDFRDASLNRTYDHTPALFLQSFGFLRILQRRTLSSIPVSILFVYVCVDLSLFVSCRHEQFAQLITFLSTPNTILGHVFGFDVPT